MNFFGLLIGLNSLVIIGLGFIWVIRGERYFGILWWPYLAGLGLLLILVSLFIRQDTISALLGIAGASLLWGCTELRAQVIRTELGWYPFNANKIQPPFAKHIKKWKAPKF
jgi:hypothetical protein